MPHSCTINFPNLEGQYVTELATVIPCDLATARKVPKRMIAAYAFLVAITQDSQGLQPVDWTATLTNPRFEMPEDAVAQSLTSQEKPSSQSAGKMRRRSTSRRGSATFLPRIPIYGKRFLIPRFSDLSFYSS
ncbi:unnamed protein product [Gongylonema pulchrum]|uniref:Bacteriophage protein n=1 Tax=Gongylonema pulchrum TaxID=637853 RepID=A0A183EI55_9BILA|nr:unnamed protein product [Gongylonema pulchrum]